MPSLRESWECLESEQERTLFLLASLFPEGTPIPFWLLGGYGNRIARGDSRATQASLLPVASSGVG